MWYVPPDGADDVLGDIRAIFMAIDGEAPSNLVVDATWVRVPDGLRPLQSVGPAHFDPTVIIDREVTETGTPDLDRPPDRPDDVLAPVPSVASDPGGGSRRALGIAAAVVATLVALGVVWVAGLRSRVGLSHGPTRPSDLDALKTPAPTEASDLDRWVQSWTGPSATARPSTTTSPRSSTVKCNQAILVWPPLQKT